MNIAILSMQKVENFGSVLQAYALKKILEKKGHDVYFIDIKKNDKDYYLLNNHSQIFELEKEQTGIKGKLKKINKYVINRCINLFRLKRQNLEFEKFRVENLEIYKKLNNYDICIIGSDEVFNCLDSGFWGFTSQLFGNIPEARKKITYAASCGSTKYEKLPSEVKKTIIEAFGNISNFSVRDENTKEFVTKLTNKFVEKNLDPVLIYKFKSEIRNANMINVPKRYCIIYSYGNRIHSKNEIDKIKSFCKNQKLIPITIGGPQFWVSRHIVCSPFECLKLFTKADFVITDTFHGTIFSMKYAKKFAVIIRDSNRNKLEDLIKTMSCEAHVINDFSKLNDIYIIKKDEKGIESIINRELNHTIAYLNSAIEECNDFTDL